MGFVYFIIGVLEFFNFAYRFIKDIEYKSLIMKHVNWNDNLLTFFIFFPISAPFSIPMLFGYPILLTLRYIVRRIKDSFHCRKLHFVEVSNIKKKEEIKI